MNNTVNKPNCVTEYNDAIADIERNIDTESMPTGSRVSQVVFSPRLPPCNAINCLHLLYQTLNTAGWVLMSWLFEEIQVAFLHMCMFKTAIGAGTICEAGTVCVVLTFSQLVGLCTLLITSAMFSFLWESLNFQSSLKVNHCIYKNKLWGVFFFKFEQINIDRAAWLN